MNKLIAVLVLSMSGLAVSTAHAGIFGGDHREHPSHPWTGSAPEMDPSSALTALTLLLGGVTVLRSRTKK